MLHNQIDNWHDISKKDSEYRFSISALNLKKCRYANGNDFMINESGIYLLKNKEPFGRQKLFQVLEEQYKGLSQASYSLFL